MTEGPFKVRVVRGPPHSFGWLRRPELDRYYRHHFVWEAPDGAIYLHAKDAPPMVIEKIIDNE